MKKYDRRRYTKERTVHIGTSHSVGTRKEVYDSDTGMWVSLAIAMSGNDNCSHSSATDSFSGGGGDFGGGGASSSYDSGGASDSGGSSGGGD